jgi:hypothetical protein
MKKTQVILLSLLAAITYGILHDQITAHLCVEYFTIAHPPLFHTESPTLLAFCWGIIATAGLGAVLGAILAEVSQSPNLPPYPFPRLCRSLLLLLAIMALSAFLAGLLGFELSTHGILHLPHPFSQLIPPSCHARFMAVWFAHIASYLTALAGATFLILRIWTQRNKPPILALIPRTKLAIIRALILAVLVTIILYIRFVRS